MTNRKATLYLDDDLIIEGKKIAIEQRTSLSKIINELLKEYISNYNSDKKE